MTKLQNKQLELFIDMVANFLELTKGRELDDLTNESQYLIRDATRLWDEILHIASFMVRTGSVGRKKMDKVFNSLFGAAQKHFGLEVKNPLVIV